MNPFLLRPREQLTNWRLFRESLRSKPECDQLLEVARYFSQAPIFVKSYDVTQPKCWVTPWEMIGSGRWCRKSTALGMEATLRLAGWDPSRMVLKLIYDYDLKETLFVLEVDGSYWLNHEYRAVIPVAGNYSELFAFTYDGRDHVPVTASRELAA